MSIIEYLQKLNRNLTVTTTEPDIIKQLENAERYGLNDIEAEEMYAACKFEIHQLRKQRADLIDAVMKLSKREFRFCGNDTNMGFKVEDVYDLLGIDYEQP